MPKITGAEKIAKTLRMLQLEKRGMIKFEEEDLWSITEKGLKKLLKNGITLEELELLNLE